MRSGGRTHTITGWGSTFDRDRVALAIVPSGDSTVKAVVLKWDSAWGTLPKTRNVPLSMWPIAASVAVKAVQRLDGWKKLGSAERNRVCRLLEGETNALSAAARVHLRGKLGDLKSKKGDDQASALRGLSNADSALPSVVAEPITSVATKFSLSGPVKKKDHAFRGKTADAEQWVVKFADGVQIEIVAPKAPENGYHNHSVKEAAEAASYLPKPTRKVLTCIVLNPVVNPDG